VESCSNLDIAAMKFLTKETSSTIFTFEASCKFKSKDSINAPKNIPVNKNLEPQRNFYSTKKKRKSKENCRFSKPSFKEKEDITKSPPMFKFENLKQSYLSKGLFITCYC